MMLEMAFMVHENFILRLIGNMMNVHFVSALNRKIGRLKRLLANPTNRGIISKHYTDYI
jgi:hypothetical protein